MKVVCYINKLGGGGAERVMSVLANGLYRSGHDITLVTDYSVSDTYPLDPSIQHIVLDGAFTGATKKGRIQRTVRRIFQLRRICRNLQADIVISFMRDSNFRAILATLFLSTKSLISVRVDPKIGYKKCSTAILARSLYPLADGCVFQTPDAQAWFPEPIQRKSRIILNPVSDSFYSTCGEPLREKRVVSCGRLEHQKRFDLLINAFARVCDDFPEFTLEIYGTGKLEETLQAQINSIHRQERIKLMGRCSDVPNTIRDASLFVLSSDFEGLPNALMEAMALGLPVISTDCGGGGARALIENEVDGLIIPCDNAEALSEAIYSSLKDIDSAIMRGNRARQKALNYAASHVVAQWEQYIKELCQTK